MAFDNLVYQQQAAPEPRAADPTPLAALGLLLAALILASGALKLWLALLGNPLWEEAHFAVAGNHLAWAYPDIPPGMPLLARAVTELFGFGLPPLRIAGVLAAQAIPLLVYWFAEPLVGRRDALWAAIIAVIFLPLAANGTVFYTETFLQLALLGMLGFLVRALRDDRWRDWAGVGVCAAVGLLLHYRFGLVGVGVLAFLAAAESGRRLWRRPGLYLAGALAALGVLPWLVYNLTERFSSLEYHAVRRLGWRLNPEGFLGNLLEQAAAATPVFFVGLVAAGFSAARAWRGGATAAGFALALSFTIFAAYGVLAGFYETRYPHWPFMAYTPLLPFLPGVLGAFSRGSALRTALVALGPALSLAGAAGAALFVWAWANPERLPPAWRAQLAFDMEDWRALAGPLDERLHAVRAQSVGEPIVAVAGYHAALRMEWPGGTPAYVLTTPHDAFTFFAALPRAWGRDETALSAAHSGATAVLVLPQPPYLYHEPSEVAFRQNLCRRFTGLAPLGLIELAPGRLAVETYTGVVLAKPASDAEPRCVLFPELYIAQPTRGATLNPSQSMYGMAALPSGVRRLEVLLNGAPIGEAQTGIDEPAAPAPDVLRHDPAWPAVQWAFTLDATALPPGAHRLAVRATGVDGQTVTSDARVVYAPAR